MKSRALNPYRNRPPTAAVGRNRGIRTADGKAIAQIRAVLIRGMALLSVVLISMKGPRT